MIGRIIEDLHGHIFEVIDYQILPKDEPVFPIISKGEKHSLQSDIITHDGFILAEYEGSYMMNMYANGYRILGLLKLIKYNYKNDIRWKPT